MRKSLFSIYILTYFSISITILCILLCLSYYPEEYFFWEYPTSELGSTISLHGYDNAISSCIFSTMLVINALILFLIAFLIQKLPIYNGSTRKILYIKSVVALLMGIGFLLIAFPSDVSILHGIGAVLAITMLIIIIDLFIIELRSKNVISIVIFILINLSWIMYSTFVFIDAERVYMQKVIFIIVIIACILLPFMDGDTDAIDYPLITIFSKEDCEKIRGKWVNNRCIMGKDNK